MLSLTDRGGAGADVRHAVTTRLFLLVIAADHWHGLHYWAERDAFALHVGLTLAVSACAALAVSPRWTGWALWAAAALLAIDAAWAFPDHANHQYLSVLIAVVLALFDGDREEEARWALAGLRWIVVLGLAWAGVQKIAWGYYFDGSFLSFAIAERETFRTAFGWVLPGGEIERLASLRTAEGAGPYRMESVLLVGLSNLTWLSEIGLAVALVGRRTGAMAAMGTIAMLFAIELAAREVFFGLLMLNLLCLWLPLSVQRRVWPIFVGAVAVLLLTSAGWLPDWTFT